mgnify:CR=1 FL=1
MRVETNRKAIPFVSIPEKEIFTHNGRCYMRLADFYLEEIDKGAILYNAVNLETGEFAFFSSDDAVVFYPKAKLILE